MRAAGLYLDDAGTAATERFCLLPDGHSWSWGTKTKFIRQVETQQEPLLHSRILSGKIPFSTTMQQQNSDID